MFDGPFDDPLLLNDESYQGVPAEDFDTSRAEGVVAFAKNADLASQADNAAAGGDAEGSLWAAWRHAATSNGDKPVDFGFLLADKPSGGAEFEMSEAASPHSSPSSRMKLPGDLCPQKRGRMDTDASRDALLAPVAARRPQDVLFGRVEGEDRGPRPMDPPVTRTDVFHWMRQNDSQEEVHALLREEDSHAQMAQERLGPLRDRLYNEMLGHMKEADTSLIAPYPGGYGYFTRTFQGRPYGAHFRRRALADGGWAPEEVVFDQNDLIVDPSSGSTRPFVDISGPDPNRDHSLYTYGTDFVGNGAYTLHVMRPGSAIDVPPVELERTDGSVIWANAGDSFYYVKLDAEFRAGAIRQHFLSGSAKGEADATLLEEPDKRFYLSVGTTSCNGFLTMQSASSETYEIRLLDLRNPSAGLHLVASRTFGHRYEVDHRGGWLYLLTNKDGAKNSKLCRVALSALPDAAIASWEDVWVPQEGTKIDSHHCFRDFIALEGRERGECKIFIQGYGGEEGVLTHVLTFPHAAAHSGRINTPGGTTRAWASYSSYLGENNIFETGVLRYHYNSATYPGLTYEYNVRTKEHTLLREEEVPHFDSNLYRAERITTPGRSVPISLVYRRDIHPRGLEGGPFPVVLTGYGAYGCVQDLDFDGNRLSLLDRGIVYALVHVRGGGELGRSWYEEGRLLDVKNRFADFLEAAETLVTLRITAPDRLAGWGTSSGGLLVSATVNLRPDLFSAVLLEVPFVDALNTMADPTIPLTIGEWEEIGNPNERDYFYYMLEYSPYENIRMGSYPAALVTASLHDSMVGHWEPLKYVQKLRFLKTDKRPVLLKVNFHAGHGSASDRYECMRECAFGFAFLLDRLGVAERPLLGAPHILSGEMVA